MGTWRSFGSCLGKAAEEGEYIVQSVEQFYVQVSKLWCGFGVMVDKFLFIKFHKTHHLISEIFWAVFFESARQFILCTCENYFLCMEISYVSFGNSCRSWTRLSSDYWQYFYSRHFSHVCPLKVIYFKKVEKYVAYFLFMKLIWLQQQQNHQTTYHHATLLQFIQEKGKGGKNTFVSTQKLSFFRSLKSQQRRNKVANKFFSRWSVITIRSAYWKFLTREREIASTYIFLATNFSRSCECACGLGWQKICRKMHV